MSYSVQHDHRLKPGGPRPCVFSEPPGPRKRARTWTPTPRVTTTRRGLPVKASMREREGGKTNPHTEHTHTQASGPPPGDEEGESQREGVRAFHLTPIGAAGNGLEPSLYAGSGAFLAEGSAVSGLGLGGRCKVNPTTL